MFDREFGVMRPAPFMGHPDYRIHEMNRRLQQRMDDSDHLWWDAFSTEFFEDDAILTLSFTLEDGPKRYTIGRSLIPRYFRSLFEGGVTDIYYVLKYCKESFHNASILLDCEQAYVISYHGRNVFTKVITDGHLILEFTFDDLMRIRSWHFITRQHHELVPRSVLSVQQNMPLADQITQNITCQGLTKNTLNFLRLCVILEPMQELMCRHKVYGLSPRDCLKTTLFQKWQRIVAPPETSRPAAKRRKKKANSKSNNNPPSPSPSLASLPRGKKSSSGANNTTPNHSNNPNMGVFVNPGMVQDVMLVGEPTLMGGELGEEDERVISRLENSQYRAPPLEQDELVDNKALASHNPSSFGSHNITQKINQSSTSNPANSHSSGIMEGGATGNNAINITNNTNKCLPIKHDNFYDNNNKDNNSNNNNKS